jgi:2-dehydropantoate 2-reductase
VRKHKLDRYKTEGVHIRCLDLRKAGRTVIEEDYHPNFVDDFSSEDGYDYILVAVNSNQLPDLLPMLNEKSGCATIVFLQNLHIGDDERIGQYLDRNRYIIAYPFKAGGGSSGNTIDAVIFGFPVANTVIGEIDGSVTTRVQALHHLLKKANMNPKIIPDIIPYVRTHYVWAACCMVAYIKAGTYERFCQSDIIKESYLAMRECWEICIKQGINPRRVTPNKYHYLPFFLLVTATKWLYAQKGVRELFEGHIQHSPGEMKDMYFTLLAEGKKYAFEMPVYEGYQKYVEDYFRRL